MERRDGSREPDAALNARDIHGKRRKIRKGTHSCRECKRRKIKCQFIAENDVSCVGCRRRGAPCVSQEFDGDPGTLGDINPIVRVETLLQQVLGRLNEPQDAQSGSGIALPEHVSAGQLMAEAVDTGPNPQASSTPTHATPSSKHAKLSRTLYAAFPSVEFLDVLRQASRTVAITFYLMNIKSHKELERDGVDIGAKLEPPPTPDMHPALLARQMLIFALLLQHLKAKQLSGLAENHQLVMSRLASTAIYALTANEELLGTAEGLECLMLRGVYESNCGNLRQSWLTFRKALVFGQLIGIHRPDGLPLPTVDPGTKINRQFLWFRIVHMDRFLSLMLGLPQGSNDMSMASDAALANETPIGRVERIHTWIAGRILQRNESSPFCEDYSVTREIDAELLKAATALPSKFWLSPTFTDTAKDVKHEFWETVRLTVHMIHYNLLCQLHLPYLLRPRCDRSYEYSRMACANASREILSRFSTYTHFKHFSNFCRRVDFFALLASMTLLFAHIDGHRKPTADNLLTHQRLNDHAMTCQVLEIMEYTSNMNHDELSKKGVRLLQCLLNIESWAANGKCYTVCTLQGGDELQQTSDAVRINIPYFGIVEISCVGDVPKDVSTHHRLSHSASITDRPTDEENTHRLREQSPASQSMGVQGLENDYTPGMFEVGVQEDIYPGVTAGLDDWAFQGADMAFFESLTRGLYEPNDIP
ncbi:hypothetical protein BJX99DRAFT_271487 [Aspergillus californicus]